MNGVTYETKNVIGALCGSFERQLGLYRELRDSARTTMSRLVLSRGDVGVLMAGVDKKARLLERVNEERTSVSGEVAYWQEHRGDMAHDKDAAALNDILGRMETVISEFLAEEEKLKQYLEKIFPKTTEPQDNG